MSKNRELKEQVVADIVKKLDSAQSVVICSYSGLTVEKVTELRKKCRENDVAYCVLKNRLVKLALEKKGIAGLDDLLNGPNAFVFGMKDSVSAPKIISEFVEKNKLDSLKMTGGIVENAAVDAKTMEVLAKMPSRDEMLATIVGCLQSPISSLVAVLDQIAEQKATA
ncbi:MAG: 50S ribosomal protein L10 [bacterium]|nr:50S ribosomal protein L10 [bacterium]